MSKRKLTDNEINDILQFDPDFSILQPEDVRVIVEKTIKDKLKKQLEDILIVDNPKAINMLKEEILRHYYTSKIVPGEPVGILAASSVSQPNMQQTLNTFHQSGIGEARGATTGLKRVNELLSTKHKDLASNMTIPFKQGVKLEEIYVFANSLEFLLLKDIINSIDIKKNRELSIEEKKCYRFYRKLYCDDLFEEKNIRLEWSIRLIFDKEKIYKYKLDMIKISVKLEKTFGDIYCIPLPEYMGIIDIYFDLSNVDNIIDSVIKDDEIKKFFDKNENEVTKKENIYLHTVCQKILEKFHIQGLEGISKTYIINTKNNYYVRTIGSNLTDLFEMLRDDIIDVNAVETNNLWNTCDKYGIEAARQFFIKELNKVYTEGGSNIDNRHIQLLSDSMTHSGRLNPLNRYGIKYNCGPLSRASFEIPIDIFAQAATNQEKDNLKGVSANIMIGKNISRIGTGACDVVFDTEKFEKLNINPLFSYPICYRIE